LQGVFLSLNNHEVRYLVIGGIALDEVLSEREHINNMLRTRLDEVTERWGVKVTNVEIREIIPPREVQEAMNRQMSAERIRRAVVTESTGTREAAINVAEGDKQANILKAEGETPHEPHILGRMCPERDEKGGWIEALKILSVDRISGAEAENARKASQTAARVRRSGLDHGPFRRS
jgi:regulator of protease activity HflC (stomatin/prohibitin superfamily)